jgi:Cytochrome c7 and related cytochrome c
MTGRRAMVLTGILLSLTTAGLVAASQGATIFPHEKHATLFPVCEGCHAGIVNGSTEQVFPRNEDCVRCHDGVRVKRVDWRPPTRRNSILRFSHQEHRAGIASAGDSTTCQTCHATTDPPRRMLVAGPDPNRCVQCHAHRNEAHITPTASCRKCHVAIAEAPWVSAERIARFPKPAWHDAQDFASTHGQVTETQSASCAICHARETCERCHANADRLTLAASLPRDRRIASLESGHSARYDAPASHREEDWRDEHGALARQSVASCANCHTRPSCEKCHAGGRGTSRTAILTLPGPGVKAGLGVSPSRVTRAVHSTDFPSRHGAVAASGGMDCAQCHAEKVCADCHAAPDSRRFHSANFVERHAADVFTNAADCQTCHNTQRFCLDCHRRTGIAAGAQMNAAFHNGQATWILSHGQAARTGMESCASCHRQNDCVRCHSATGGWGVNPHRPGFQASALGARNSASCRWCHLGALPGGGH